MKKYAVIDIGSNSTHMDIIELDIKNIKVKHLKYKTLVNKLGIDIFDSKNISLNKIEELSDFIIECANISKQMNVSQMYVFATSCLREAENSKEVINYLKEKTGYLIDVISSNQETKLTYESVNYLYDLKDKNTFIIDIGGGSTEIILTKNTDIIFENSFDIGISKIKRKLNITTHNFDEATKKQTQDVSKDLIQNIINEIPKEFISTDLIGTSSIFDTFGFIIYDYIKELSDLKDKDITTKDLIFIIDELTLDNINIEPNKKDILFIGAIFMLELIKILNLDKILIAPWSIREPYIINAINKGV
jgi:exopolyphosphatase / guanosine-5'-triphosphate,3'-diphosphate pyrophosphatase